MHNLDKPTKAVNSEKAGQPLQRLYRFPDVVKMIGLCRTTIYEMFSRGEFPKPVRLSGRAIAWRENDLRDWINSRAS